jgi:hypothetical protein
MKPECDAIVLLLSCRVRFESQAQGARRFSTGILQGVVNNEEVSQDERTAQAVL